MTFVFLIVHMSEMQRKLGKLLDKYTWQCYNKHKGDAKCTWQNGTYDKEAHHGQRGNSG